MSDKFNNFINGEDFTNESIQKILKDNNIDGKILTIQFRPFKKIFIKIENKNGKLFIIKICLDRYSIELAQNESYGYANLDKIKFKSFNTPDFKLIMSNESMSISKIEFINGSKEVYNKLRWRVLWLSPKLTTQKDMINRCLEGRGYVVLANG